jgi:hypothetical protein
MPILTFFNITGTKKGPCFPLRTASFAVPECMARAISDFPVRNSSHGDVDKKSNARSKCADDNDSDPS